MTGSETIFSALVIVTLFLIVLSLPSAYVTLSHSSRQFKRFVSLRGRDMTEVHPKMLNEWNAVKTDVGYIQVLSEELEKIGALRPAIFNSEISAILIVILMFVPGFESDVLILMCVLLALCIFLLFYGYRVTKRYGEEYVRIARSMSGKGEESKDSMYV